MIGGGRAYLTAATEIAHVSVSCAIRFFSEDVRRIEQDAPSHGHGLPKLFRQPPGWASALTSQRRGQRTMTCCMQHVWIDGALRWDSQALHSKRERRDGLNRLLSTLPPAKSPSTTLSACQAIRLSGCQAVHLSRHVLACGKTMEAQGLGHVAMQMLEELEVSNPQPDSAS